jgi:hypothetical protein
MRIKRYLAIIALAFITLPLWAGKGSSDTTQLSKKLYRGMTIKLDIGESALTAGMSKGRLQQYEIAMNWQLTRRFYPTLELGYAGGKTEQGDSISYNAHGGYFRVGCDINPLRKHPESPHAMLIGIRIATDFQPRKVDCWGEIVAGCQVQVWENKKSKVQGGLYMGWMGRLKILFTREKDGLLADEMGPIYIPGYGKRGNISWGLSYHMGWKF